MSAYALNLMMYDLRKPENRQLAQQNLRGYLDRYDLTETEKQPVLDGDWQGCIEAGVSVYVLTKMGATVDISLLQMGAQMRGETFPQFLDMLREQNERVATHALLSGSGGGERG